LCGVGQVQGYNNDDGDDNNYNHNSLFLVSLDLAEHSGCTKWDFKSESNQMLLFGERGKPEYPGKNLPEQIRELTEYT